jgi:hypothetical protein
MREQSSGTPYATVTAEPSTQGTSRLVSDVERPHQDRIGKIISDLS